jgi:hypothetical protein
MRDPVALIIRRPSVQVRPAPLVFPQVRGLRSDARLPKSSLSRGMWHICGTSRNSNPPVAGSSGTCPVTFAQVKRLDSGLIPSGTVLGQGPCGTFVAQRECDRREQQRGARGRPMSGLGWRACPRIRLAGLSGGQQIPPFSCLRAVHSGLRLRHQQGGVPARDGGDRAPDRFGPTKQGPRTSSALRR